MERSKHSPGHPHTPDADLSIQVAGHGHVSHGKVKSPASLVQEGSTTSTVNSRETLKEGCCLPHSVFVFECVAFNVYRAPWPSHPALTEENLAQGLLP